MADFLYAQFTLESPLYLCKSRAELFYNLIIISPTLFFEEFLKLSYIATLAQPFSIISHLKFKNSLQINMTRTVHYGTTNFKINTQQNTTLPKQMNKTIIINDFYFVYLCTYNEVLQLYIFY